MKLKQLAVILLLGVAFLFAAKPHAMLPNPTLTPGVADSRVTQQTIRTTICKPGYTASVRSVSAATKRAVMQRYGLPASELSKVEINHFFSLEIGGSNDVENLWPEYYDPAPGQTGYLGAREKDVVETWLRREVCMGVATLAEAQTRIRDWPEEYRKLKAQ